MAIHTLPNNGLSVEWLTPPHIIRSLGKFNLDPASYPGQYRTAGRMVSPPEDGLSVDWYGRVWLNPPYGIQLKRWIEKLSVHGNGIALVPSRTEVESWFCPFVWNRADSILFIRGRISFLRPDMTRTRGNSGHGSVLVSYGDSNSESVKKSGIPGRLVYLKDTIDLPGKINLNDPETPIR